MKVSLTAAKAAVAEDLPPGHPGREALLALPDAIPASRFDAIFPILVRLLKFPSRGCPGAAETARGMEARRSVGVLQD